MVIGPGQNFSAIFSSSVLNSAIFSNSFFEYPITGNDFSFFLFLISYNDNTAS